MAVPNTGTFSFQDVTTEIYGDTVTGRNLVQAFTDAIGTFDPTYVGTKNGLLCFRNYSHIPNDVRVILHTVSVNINIYKLNWEFVIQNGTSSNHTVSVRIKNVTQGSAYFTLYTGTAVANTISSALSGLTVPMGFPNSVGNTFAIELDLDSAGTYIGTIQAANALTLNYDWML